MARLASNWARTVKNYSANVSDRSKWYPLSFFYHLWTFRKQTKQWIYEFVWEHRIRDLILQKCHPCVTNLCSMPTKNYWSVSKSLWTSSNMVPSGWLLRVWRQSNPPKHHFQRKIGCKDSWSRFNCVTNFRSMPRKNYRHVFKIRLIWCHSITERLKTRFPAVRKLSRWSIAVNSIPTSAHQIWRSRANSRINRVPSLELLPIRSEMMKGTQIKWIWSIEPTEPTILQPVLPIRSQVRHPLLLEWNARTL
mgnify:CR=1 FL=1